MCDCPFLSCGDKKVECFTDCALYNFKENEGVCPFKTLQEQKLERMEEFDEFDTEYKDLNFIKNYYLEMKKEYL
ncbi:hypothetical protein [Clostridium rectalis]|uniref:hypothetical protein n=1 Tax=Clostridium rectalis TaxID=2040295 RepID=UPI000F645050|nr:hypothetical protein [Clostridium rectalis]